MSVRPVRPFLFVAAAAIAVAGVVFWRDVSRVRSPYSGQGAIAAFAAPKTAFPMTPLLSTSLFSAPPQAAASAPRASVPRPSVAPPDALFTSRRLVRTAELSIEVRSWDGASTRVGEVATELGGYVADIRAGRTEERWRGTLVVRVPVDRFQEAFERLAHLGKTEAQSSGTQDVTRTVVDLEARIRVKRDVVERMRTVLRERTAKLSEIIEAEEGLAKVVEELEQLESQRRLLEQQTTFSTITLNLSEPAVGKPATEPSVFRPVGQAFRESGAVLASSLAAAIYTVVVGLPWALLAIALWTLVGRVRARRRAAFEALLRAREDG